MKRPLKLGASISGALLSLGGEDVHDIPKAGPPAQPARSLRLQRGAEHLHRRGASTVAELLAHIGRDHDCVLAVLDTLDDWLCHLSPELLRAVGGNRCPPHLAVLP